MKFLMEQMDDATTLIAAAAHDLDHPGKSSAFLSNSDNPLAILYNDVTVLESHHAAFMFKLTLGKRCFRFLSTLLKIIRTFFKWWKYTNVLKHAME